MPYDFLFLGLLVEIEHSAGVTKCVISRLSPTGYRVRCGCHEISIERCISLVLGEFLSVFDPIMILVVELLE